MNKITRYISVYLVAMLALTTVPAIAVQPGGVGGRPANPDPNIARSDSIFIYELEENERANDALIVSNNSSDTKTIEVYAVDAQTTNTGSFACRQKVEPREGVGSWISLAQDTVTLEPATRETIDITVQMPAVADVGEHNGCVVFAVVNDNEENDGGGVSLSYRSAIRVAITVPGDIIKELTFQDLTASLKREDGFTQQNTYILSPTLENTGNVSLDTEITVRMTSLLGNEITNGGTFPVLPRDGMSLQLPVTPSFWGGLYRVSADATYNENPDVGIGQGNEEDLKTLTQKAGWVFVAPTAAALSIITAIILAVAGIIIYWLYRKGTILNSSRNRKLHRVGSGENIQKIAQTYNVSWKKLARINKLKPPYTVKSGMRLYVPADKRKR